MIVREGLEKHELAADIYWSDFKKPCKNWKNAFDYEHITNLKLALKILHVSQQDANNKFVDKKLWKELLITQKKGTAYAQWKIEKENERSTRKEQQKENNDDGDQEVMYHKRPLP